MHNDLSTLEASGGTLEWGKGRETFRKLIAL